MEELEDNVVLFIDSIKIPQERNLKIVRESNWMDKKTLPEKEELYKIHRFFVERAVDNATTLYNMCNGDTRKRTVKDILETLAAIFNVQSERIETYIRENDWSVNLITSGQVLDSMLQEGEFQSGMLKDINASRARMQKVNIGDNIKSVNVPIFGDQPVPLIMRQAFEKKFPEIKEYIQNRIEASKK